jgi:hypothetical protein
LFEGKTTADKAPRAKHGFKNGLFLVNLGTKMTSLFAMYTIIGTKTSTTADKAPRANHGFKNGLFSANLGTKMTSLFAMYTIIGTKTSINPCHRHQWPLLYLFEGKAPQPTKRRAPIVHSKMDFSL